MDRVIKVFLYQTENKCSKDMKLKIIHNLSNKMNRDKFSALELVEIADALGMNLILKDKDNGKEYIIDYPDDLKGKSKRNMTEEEKRAAQEKSMQTKARRAKTAEN